jgi:hypothetical protein
VLPSYVPKLTHDLERVLRKFVIQIAYDSSGKLEDLLGNQKQKTPDMEKSGIYIIKCKKCGAYYIGQSKRRIGKRLGEHEGYINACLLATSGIADHILTENYDCL